MWLCCIRSALIRKIENGITQRRPVGPDATYQQGLSRYFRTATNYIRDTVLRVYLESEQLNNHPSADKATPGRVTSIYQERTRSAIGRT
jgi:hypothetical protein